MDEIMPFFSTKGISSKAQDICPFTHHADPEMCKKAVRS
jgi:hypothetical protein